MNEIRMQPRGVTNIESVREAIESYNEFHDAEDAMDAIKRWATSPVVDMVPHPTDEIGVVVPDFHLEAFERFTRRGVLSISDLRAQHIADWEQAHEGLSDEQVNTAMQVDGYRIKKIDIADDDELAIQYYSPHPTGDGFPDYAGQLLQTITSNLGIPADVITAEPMSSGRSEAIIHMQMFNDRVKAYEAAMREIFRPAIVVLHKAFVQFSDAFYAAACLLYREQVGRLPGSERTSRLRKKRRDRVLDWYLNTFLPGDQE
jgi:hypothetical protein